MLAYDFSPHIPETIHEILCPFQIEARVGLAVYRLVLAKGTRVHYVFHVSLLKKRVGSDTPKSGKLPPLRANGLLRLKPKQVLQVRDSNLEGESHKRVSTMVWFSNIEDMEHLKQSFPTINLEDKVHLFPISYFPWLYRSYDSRLIPLSI